MIGALPRLRGAAAEAAGAAAFGASGSYAPYGGGAGGGTTYNVYIDGDVLSVDSRMREAFSAFIEAVARRRSMGRAVMA